jgi:hypothetical protein
MPSTFAKLFRRVNEGLLDSLTENVVVRARILCGAGSHRKRRRGRCVIRFGKFRRRWRAWPRARDRARQAAVPPASDSHFLFTEKAGPQEAVE